MTKKNKKKVEKEIENEKIEKEEKNKKNAKKSRSEKVVDEGVEVPYPLVPSKKEKDRHRARFLDIFRKLEITMPFGEALQQMPLSSRRSFHPSIKILGVKLFLVQLEKSMWEKLLLTWEPLSI